jgi:3-dehydroquinate synthase
MTMQLTVNTTKPYDIFIEHGCLDTLGERCTALFPAGAKAAVISDSNVFPLYGERACDSLRRAGFSPSHFVFPAGEASKQLSTVGEMLGFLAEQGLTRSDFLVALGGGVTGDMAGFAAACYLRGVSFVQVPTSLLAQVDSSVGGKTAVDLPQGKNLAGAFHQPALVLIDPDTLDTLPPLFFADGMGEVIKYGCIRSRSLFETLRDADSLSPLMESILYDCVDCKRVIVEHDEFDTGERMVLNFGHTLGHGLEKAHGYTGLTHGAAVGIGMVLIARLGEHMGLTKAGTAEQIAAVLQKYHLPVSDNASLDEVIRATALDKKGLGGDLRIVLLRSIGESFVHRLPRAEFAALCRASLAPEETR